MPSKSFTIEGNHCRPVGAGTLVSFQASSADPDGLSQYDLKWHVLGPDSDTSREYIDDETFDWDTTGLQPGRYTVYCVRRLRHEGPPAVAEAEAPQGEEASDAAVLFGNKDGPIAVAAKSGRGKTEPGCDPQTKGGWVPANVPDVPPEDISEPWHLFVEAASGAGRDGVVPVSLQRTAIVPTASQVLWIIIRNRTNAIGFRHFRPYCDSVMCREGGDLAFRGTQAYELLKETTDAFLMQETGVLDPSVVDGTLLGSTLDPDLAVDDIERQMADPVQALRLRIEERRRLGDAAAFDDVRAFRNAYYRQLEGENVLPYMELIRNKLRDIPLKPAAELPANCYGILRSQLSGPLAIELIWSYWQEEGMLAQSLNAIMARFENRKLVAGRPDPLTRLDIDPLRPLGNLLWGWIQDEYHRLTVRRRAFEYDHEYGLRLVGKAIPNVPVVDSRTKFLGSFHNVLHLAHVFFKEDDDTTVIADGFPLLNALRETHLLLAEGAHNQFGDLPTTARAEMLIMQWLLARPEMREFIGGKIMVPYEEEWMDRVDTMKAVQGWTNVTITHFRDMAVFGEQILLSIRYGHWSVVNDPQEAANWARYWRPEIQRYTHAYRASTGVDVTERVDATMPSSLLQRQLVDLRRRG